ncbi:MAG: SDR family NAD(P)-dependent oxidoreductase [Sedimentibacter sp.]
MLKNVLITGGAGFIGSSIALKLVDKGYNVRVMDNLSPQIHGENASLPKKLIGKVDFIKGDVRSTKDWKRAIDGQNAVIHLAAETGTGQSMYEIFHYCDSNIGGTAKFMDILANEKHSIKRVVIATSRAIYGEGMYRCKEHDLVYPEARNDEDMAKGDFECKCTICKKDVEICKTKENTLIHPTSIYGITKQVQEQLVMVTCHSLGIPAISFRYQNVYGPGQSLSNPYTGIISIFSTRIRNGKDINIFEDGKESRDFVFIDDVANITIEGLEREDITYESFNVGSGVMTSVNEVVEALELSYGKNVKIEITGNYRVGDIRHNYADISKTEKLLGYKPMTDFKTGIKRFTDWVLTQDETNDGYEASLKEMEDKGLLK